MRNLYELDALRMTSGPLINMRGGWTGDDTQGAFIVPCPGSGVQLRVIASAALGWDHVSVSLPGRCPTWDEMEYVKRLFFLPEEVAMQLHVPVEDHINRMTTCLHIWRPHEGFIPVPPNILV